MFELADLYARLPSRHAVARRRFGRAITLTEKILFAHLANPETAPFKRGKSFLDLHPDRVAMQDATAQMALLQFMLAGKPTTAVPTTVHCDHLIRARSGATADLAAALGENAEVYEFLRSACQRHGIGFWQPGVGIIHQVILENTPQGLRIQLVDQDGRPMFQQGSNQLMPYARKLLASVGGIVSQLPNRVSISGHTGGNDVNATGGAWELSACRANQARAVLQAGGLGSDRIYEGAGKAGSEPLLPEDPNASANRRLSILLVRESPPVPTNTGLN